MQLSFDLGAAPAGFVYLPDFIDAAAEAALLATLATIELSAVVMHGTAAKRTVAHFGHGYGYDAGTLDEAPPLPDWVQPLLPRVAAAMHEAPAALVELLVTRYPPGARIGWHRDAPMFGPAVAGLSLGAPGTLQLRRRHGDGFERWSREILPRSLYVIGGAARSAWQHMLAPVAPGPDRWSLTFRTLRTGGKPSRATLRRAGAG